MKSLLKGLRYVSQIFENEKEPDMKIGTPTDVKHVAHIGWDGGSVNQSSPSWMNDFNASGGFSSAPLGNIIEDASCIPEDSTRSRDRPGLPKSTRDRSNNNNVIGSPTKERSRRVNNNKTSRRSSKESNSEILLQADGSTKSRRKKSKDSVNGGSSRSSRRSSRRESQTESMSGSMSDVESTIILN